MREASGNGISISMVLQSDDAEARCRRCPLQEPAVVRAQTYKDGHNSTLQTHIRKKKTKIIRFRILSILNTFY